jgi:RNA polymerase sigma factor (sigma-70 family)
MLGMIASISLEMFGKRSKYNKLEDDALLIMVLKNDELALNILISRYNKLVFGVCLKYLNSIVDAEDLSQDIFISLKGKIFKHAIINFRPWLYRVVKNECLMKLRRKKHFYTELHDGIIVSEDVNSISMLLDLQIELLTPLIEKLTNTQAICIKEFYITGKSYKEITEQLNLDLMTVKSNIQNGKRKLKILLELELSKTTQDNE